MSRRRNAPSESSSGQDLGPGAQAKLRQIETAIAIFFEEQELEVSDLDVALQAREAYSSTGKFIGSVASRYPLFKQDIELLEEKLHNILEGAEVEEESKPPPCPCSNTGVIAVVVAAVVLVVLVCLGLALAVLNASGEWALVAMVCAICLFILGMVFLICICKCYLPPPKEGDAMYEFGISNDNKSKQTDFISL